MYITRREREREREKKKFSDFSVFQIFDARVKTHKISNEIFQTKSEFVIVMMTLLHFFS